MEFSGFVFRVYREREARLSWGRRFHGRSSTTSGLAREIARFELIQVLRFFFTLVMKKINKNNIGLVMEFIDEIMAI